MGIFDLNTKAVVVKEPFMGSNLYYIDNFYKNPDQIADLFKKLPNVLYNSNGSPYSDSYNGVYFLDKRVMLKTDEIIHAWKHLSNMIGGYLPVWPHGKCQDVVVNQFKFMDKKFITCKDHFWHPHNDSGFTALVYFNKNDDICGTNLYKKIQPDLPSSRGEHVDPWRSKKNWERMTTLKPAFNRCVIFDGDKFAHGMNVVDDRYSGEEYRMNQVFFFGKDSSEYFSPTE